MYVVYEQSTTKRIDMLAGGQKYKTCFGSMLAAQRAKAKFLAAQNMFDEKDILIAEHDKFYKEIEKTVTGVSAQDGVTPVSVRANTPYCCDPRHERYWSM